MSLKVFATQPQRVPRRGVVSPLLANIALYGMEEALVHAFLDGTKTLSARQRVPKLIRYADDFVVLHPQEAEVLKAQQLIAAWLQGIGLELKPSKTRLSHTLNEYQGHVGFTFLGVFYSTIPRRKNSHWNDEQRQTAWFQDAQEAKQRRSPTPFASTQEDSTEESLSLARATH